MNDSITRFDKDMDGSMEPSDHGRWVRYDDHAKRIADLERAQHDTQADASRWRFTRDNRLQYFEPTRHWRMTSSDGHVICEGRAANYETAVDAAMQAARLAEAPKP